MKHSQELIIVNIAFTPIVEAYDILIPVETQSFKKFWMDEQQRCGFPSYEEVIDSIHDRGATDPFMVCYGHSSVTEKLLFILFVSGGSEWQPIYSE